MSEINRQFADLDRILRDKPKKWKNMARQMFNVSIVIPAYNEAPRICHAFESVLKQIQLVKEIIVVDEGSKDGTGRKGAGKLRRGPIIGF